VFNATFNNIQLYRGGQFYWWRKSEYLKKTVGCDSLDVSALLYIFFSLVNIYKELEKDIDGFKHPGHGTLIGWSKQGINYIVSHNVCILYILMISEH
jgi:hypothetical protein